MTKMSTYLNREEIERQMRVLKEQLELLDRLASPYPNQAIAAGKKYFKTTQPPMFVMGYCVRPSNLEKQAHISL